MMRGEQATIGNLRASHQSAPLRLPSKIKLNVPFNLPSFALGVYSVKVFNALYYAMNPKPKKESIVDYDPFFYPVDSIYNWNRIYGKQGFTQYQVVSPKETRRNGLEQMLSKISKSGMVSFLAVLKIFGKQEGELSFYSGPQDSDHECSKIPRWFERGTPWGRSG